jgi:hypothetical protein
MARKTPRPTKVIDRTVETGINALNRAVEGTKEILKASPRPNAVNSKDRRANLGKNTTDEDKRRRNRIGYAKKKAAKLGRPWEEVLAEMDAQATYAEDNDGRKAKAPLSAIIHPDEMALPSSTDPANSTKPGEWIWDQKKLTVCEALADGNTIENVVSAYDVGKTTIYRWMNHPSGEFWRYYDKLITEMSIANKRIRIARMTRVNDKLFAVAEAKFEQLLDQSGKGAEQISAESLKGIISELRETSQLIAKERQELPDVTINHNNNNNTNVNIDGDAAAVEAYIKAAPADEQAELRARFSQIADRRIAELRQGS